MSDRQHPIEGKWYWVKIRDEWFPALRSWYAAGGWSCDTWEDRDGEVESWQAIDLPFEPSKPQGPPSLDDLLQRAADNTVVRHAQYLDAIAICAEAVQMGPGAVSKVAEHLFYKANTVRKLARMVDLPEDLVYLDVKPGVYWVFFLYSDNPVYELREALADGVDTPAKAKEWLGVKEERRRAQKAKMLARVLKHGPDELFVTMRTDEPLPPKITDVELSWEVEG